MTLLDMNLIDSSSPPELHVAGEIDMANVDQFRDTLEEEASLMIRRLLEDPTNFVGPVRKYVLANWGHKPPRR